MRIKSDQYVRMGEFVVKRDEEGNVVSLYRFNEPHKIYVPTKKISIGTASVRESRGTLEKILIRKKGVKV